MAVWPRQQCGTLVGGRLNRGAQPGAPQGGQKKPRRRVATLAQRRAANIRERRRMFNLNEAFDKLRRKVVQINIFAFIMQILIVEYYLQVATYNVQILTILSRLLLFLFFSLSVGNYRIDFNTLFGKNFVLFLYIFALGSQFVKHCLCR